MAIDKIRQRATPNVLPNAPTDEWAYLEVIDDRLQFNSDGANTRIVMDSQVETVGATNTILASENGRTYFLSSATEFVSTLPAPAAGLQFTFIVAAAPSGASYTVVTAGAAQIIVGHVLTSGFNDSPADVETTLGATTITFVDGVSVMGDRAHVISDGTNWYASALCAVEAGITYTG